MTDLPPRPYSSAMSKMPSLTNTYSVFLVDANQRKLAMFYSKANQSEAAVKLVDFIARACNAAGPELEPPPTIET